MARSPFHALFALLALAPPSWCLGVEAGHDGRSHKHVERRPVFNGPVPGLGVISSPAATPDPNLPRPTGISPPSNPAAASGSATVPIAVVSSTYSFPTTVVQVAIATVCPDAPATSAAFAAVPPSVLAGMNATHASRHITVAVNATALLANGSAITFLSHITSAMTVAVEATPLPTADPDEAAAARIVLGPDGCQTLYAARTTALCSTTLSLGGQLPVPVTDCGQYVTFSSSAVVPAACAAMAAQSGSAMGAATAYFAAPWYELAAGLVPALVQVASCVGGRGGQSCQTGTERWTVSTSTGSSLLTRTLGFTGAAVLTHGAVTITTTVEVDDTKTVTNTVLVPTIVRGPWLGPADGTVTVVRSMPTTQTVQLDQVVHSTVTVWQTVVETSAVTSTRGQEGV